MTRVYVSIGSNIEPRRNVATAIEALRTRFGGLTLSPVYETAAVGFDGDNFHNLAVGFDTDHPLDAVWQALRDIEDQGGRDRTVPRFSPRAIDLDLLLYGDEVRHDDRIDVPRAEITEQAFVLRPLADIAADVRHPELRQTIGALWQAFAGARDMHEVTD